MLAGVIAAGEVDGMLGNEVSLMFVAPLIRVARSSAELGWA
jgi:hypothetical protein